MNRRGFSLIEMLTVVAIIGLLASIAVPKYQYLRKKAVAVDIVAAMVAVRTGAYNYSETAGTWPPSGGLGQVPVGLGQYLPGSLQFTTPDYQLTWTNISVVVGGQTVSYQLLWALFQDGQLCQGVAGLWGGSSNTAVIPVCGGWGGVVVLFVDS